MKEDWIECSLGEVCTIQTGKNDANHAKEDGKYRFYTCAFDYLKCDTKRFRGKSIILPGNGANVGEVFYYNGEFDAYQRTYVINQIKINPKYLFYHLKGFWKVINIDKQFGSATNYIRMGNFTDYKIPICSLSEQQAIVNKIEELFSSLDSGIADLKKAQEQLKIYRQAVLKKAFEGELTNVELTSTILNKLIHSVEYGTSEKSLKEGKVPVLRMGNMQRGVIDWDDLKYTSNEKDIEKYLLNKDDVLFNRTNSPEHVGKTSIFLSNRKAIFAGYLIRIKYDKEKILGKYLNYYLNSHRAKVYGNEVKTDGVNQSNINGAKLKKYPIPICSLKEQHQIVQEIESRLSVCDAVEESIATSLEKAQALRQSILKKAFEGKLLSEEEIAKCKADPNYEPASVLLEKIKSEKKKKKK